MARQWPRFSHLDDLPWQEVRASRHGDHTASVREKWLDFSPRFLSLLRGVGPGHDRAAHGHNSDHVVFVLEGDDDVRRRATAGRARTSRSTRATRSARSSPGPTASSCSR